MHDGGTGTVRTIHFDKHILLVLSALTIKVEQFLIIGIKRMLPAIDDTLSSIYCHLEMCFRVAGQTMILSKCTLVEANTHHQATCSRLRYAPPIGITAHGINLGQPLLGKLQVAIALLDNLFAGCAWHLDIWIASRVESLQYQGHIAIFLYQIEEVESTEEVSLGYPAVLLGIAQRRLTALGDDVITDTYLIIRVGPVA